jgi:hypothetical protein
VYRQIGQLNFVQQAPPSLVCVGGDLKSPAASDHKIILKQRGYVFAFYLIIGKFSIL